MVRVTLPELGEGIAEATVACFHLKPGGPVGVDNLAAAIGEERDTIEDVLEPYLIQQGYLKRTPRGRMATVIAFRHFDIPLPGNGLPGELWEESHS